MSRLPRQDYIDWTIRNSPVEILLSQAGRVPGLAFANMKL